MTTKTTYYPPELKDTPIQGGGGSTLIPGATSKYVYAPPEIHSQVFPTYSRVREVVGPTLDTQSKKILGKFGFTKQGAFVVGSLSGPGVAMTQNGITAKNSSGVTTFAIDAATGNATFLGTIKVGTSIETGALVVGTNVGLGTAQDSAGVTTIIGNVVTTGYVNALNVTAQSVSASWVYAGNINASQITAGTLSANFISGGSLVIGGSSDALGTIVVKNSSNVEIAKLNSSGIIVRNTRGLFFESVSSGDYFSIQNNSSSEAVFILPNSNKFLIKDSAGTTNLFTINASGSSFLERPLSVNGAVTCKEIFLNYGQNEGNIRNLDWLEGYNDLYLKCQGTNYIKFESSTDDSGTDNITFYPHWGDIYKTGSVSFRIPHPDHPNDGWIHYICNEGPEASLTLRGIGTLNKGMATITVPRHWELVSADILTTVNITPLGECRGLFVPKASLSRFGFMVKELSSGKSNIDFSWELTVVRKNYENFNPEPTFSDEADKMVEYLIDKEKNRDVYVQNTIAKNERYDKIKILTRQKYESRTGKELVNGGDERPRLLLKELAKLKSDTIIVDRSKL